MEYSTGGHDEEAITHPAQRKASCSKRGGGTRSASLEKRRPLWFFAMLKSYHTASTKRPTRAPFS